MVKIKDVMMVDMLTAPKTETVLQMAERLHKHKIGAIVIIDKHNFPIGIVSERDIIRAFVTYKENSTHKMAQDIMSAPVLTLEPTEDIETAAILMELNTIRRIPIVEDGNLIGLISYRDITNALRKSYFTLEEKTEFLEDKANRDPLTGIYNKGYLMEQLVYHIELAKRSDDPMSLLMIDIDHFKNVNDTYGHLCGDDVLKKLTHILTDKSRAINIVGRYGGEEFAIIGPIGDHKSSMYLGERLREVVEKETFMCGDKEFKLTISVGVAIWNQTIETPEQLIQLADDALYDAKHSGRNQVKLADQSIES